MPTGFFIWGYMFPFTFIFAMYPLRISQHAHRFFHLGVHVPFYLHFCNVPSNSSFRGTKKMNCIFSTWSCTMLFFCVNIRPKKKCVVTVTCKKKSRVGINFFFLLLSAKPEIVVPGSGIRYFIFEIFAKMTNYAVFLPSLLSISTKS